MRDPRIIPARAGFTAPGAPSPVSHRDHPRSRGVYDDDPIDQQIEFGSSPLARGLLISTSEVLRDHRIIPARAGFTLRSFRYRERGTDHPRSRGVYVCSAS